MFIFRRKARNKPDFDLTKSSTAISYTVDYKITTHIYAKAPLKPATKDNTQKHHTGAAT
jgi:hypothetical protein